MTIMRAILVVGTVVAASFATCDASSYADFVSGLSLAGRFDDAAIQYFSAALADPKLTPSLRSAALFDRAEAYSRRNNFTAALADYSSSLQLRPTFDTFQRRAGLYEAMGQTGAASGDFNLAIALRPDLSLGYLYRSSFFARSGKFDDALADLDKAQMLSPNVPDILVLRSWTYIKKGDNASAIEAADNSMRLTGNKSIAGNLAKAAAYEAEGDLERALGATKDAIEIDRNDSFSLLSRGILEWEMKRYSDAEKTMESATRRDPYNGYGLLWLAIARADSKRTNDDIAQRASVLYLTVWPGALVKLYLGQVDIAAVLSEAKADLFEHTSRTCEADFYGALMLRMKGNPNQAKEMLQAAARDCPPGQLEARVTATLQRTEP
jgi:lipoprotein NlpI